MDDMELYCKIYVDTNQPKADLLQLTATWLNAKVEVLKYNNFILLKDRDLDITTNKDFNEQLKDDDKEGFVYYRYYLDIDPPKPLERSEAELYAEQVSFVTFLLEHFWAAGIPAIAACDFEDELPYKGGYKADVAPWLKAQVVQAR